MIVLLDIESINSSYGLKNCDFSTMNQTEELVWDGSKEVWENRC